MAAEPGIRSDLYNLGAEKESSFNERNSGPAPSFPNVQAYDCTYSLQQEALMASKHPLILSQYHSCLYFPCYYLLENIFHRTSIASREKMRL